ncbi:MAG: hypothetical protein IPM35_34755 [Myxococcales bacterium]|nr:hypothetical protein [Myxococcales bacterium]
MAERLLIVGLILFGCSRESAPTSKPEAAASATPAATSPECEKLFEPPPGAVLLCDQHDLATDAEIHWRSFGSSEARSALEKRYRELAGRCGAEVTSRPNELGIGKGPFRLSVHDAEPKGYPGCEKAPASGHLTVVLISSMFRR